MSEKESVSPILVYGLLILLALIWGSSFILIKKGLLIFSSRRSRCNSDILCCLSFNSFVPTKT